MSEEKVSLELLGARVIDADGRSARTSAPARWLGAPGARRRDEL